MNDDQAKAVDVIEMETVYQIMKTQMVIEMVSPTVETI
jgi:hypothetical protein